MTEQEQLIEELAHKLYQQVVSERGFPDTWGTERQEHKDIYIMQANDWLLPILKKYCYLKDPAAYPLSGDTKLSPVKEINNG